MLKLGDRLVLCSEGIYDEIREVMLWKLFDSLLDKIM